MYRIRFCKNFKIQNLGEYLLTGIIMLLILKNGIRGRVCFAIYQYVKANDKNKESSYLKYWDVNNLYGWEISQTLSIDNLSGLKKHCNLIKIL